MHVLLYEWVTGGGLVEQTGRLPESLLAEGAAMASALAEDFLAIEGCQVTVFRDLRLDAPAYPGCELVEVHDAQQLRQSLADFADRVDYTLAIAPEFDNFLLDVASLLRAGKATSLNASPKLIKLASSKRLTNDCLAAAGVPVPQSVDFQADQERLPADFPYPAVLKPIDGAGSQHMLLVEDATDEPPPHHWPRLLESFCAGRPASALFLCGSTGATPLPPCWQNLSADGRFEYLGGSLINDSALAERATALACRALAAVPPTNGFVGIDLILGESSDGAQDVVIEINPRATTSYVGVRQAVTQNLAEAIVDVVEGRTVKITVENLNAAFKPNGEVTTP